MVAKSYETYEQLCEPFVENGRKYVNIKAPCSRCGGSGHYSMNASDDTPCYKCGGAKYKVKTVRWYTEAERARMDAQAAEKQKIKEEKIALKFNARHAFGFKEAGFITLFIGDQTTINEWAHETNPCRARFNNLFGWYIPSDMEIPEIPVGVKTVRCDWEAVKGEDDISLLPNEKVEAIVFDLTHDGEFEAGEFLGDIGGKLTNLTCVIEKTIELDGKYGTSWMHVMKDTEHNTLIWTTASKHIPDGTVINITSAKVKDHKVYKNVNQTIVNYVRFTAKE